MQSVHNALSILEKIAVLQPIGVSELGRQTKLPKSSVHRYLRALRDAGWVDLQSDDPPRWQLSSRASSILRPSATELSLRDVAIPVMQRLRNQTGETVFLNSIDGSESVLIERVDGNRPVRTFNPLGVRMRLNGPSTGKALLAALDPEVIERILAQDLQAYTPNTITDPDRLRAELAEIRAQGYAVNNGEWRPDVAGIGAVIMSPRGRPVAAVSISMPSSRFDPDAVPRFAELVMRGAKEITEGLASAR